MAFAFIFKEHFPHGRNNFLFNLYFERNENIKSFCLFFLLFSRSSRPDVFLGKGVLKICSKFTGEHPYQSAISIKLLWNFIQITLRHGCSPVNLLHIFRTPFLKNTSGWLLLVFVRYSNRTVESIKVGGWVKMSVTMAARHVPDCCQKRH